jgi:hypothetical protein
LVASRFPCSMAAATRRSESVLAFWIAAMRSLETAARDVSFRARWPPKGEKTHSV